MRYPDVLARKSNGVLSSSSAGFYSIRAGQIGFVDRHPAHPAAPMAVGGGFPRRHVIEGAGWYDGPLAIPRGVGNRAIAVAADLTRETFRLR